MAVHIQRGGHIAVTQPRLDVLDITAALTERVYRAVSQIMEPAGQTMGLDYPPEMVGYEVRVNGRTIGLDTDAVGIDI